MSSKQPVFVRNIKTLCSSSIFKKSIFKVVDIMRSKKEETIRQMMS